MCILIHIKRILRKTLYSGTQPVRSVDVACILKSLSSVSQLQGSVTVISFCRIIEWLALARTITDSKYSLFIESRQKGFLINSTFYEQIIEIRLRRRNLQIIRCCSKNRNREEKCVIFCCYIVCSSILDKSEN